jgi:hypothetical protein
MVPPAQRRIIRSCTTCNIAVEPRNPDNTTTLYTDAPSDHLVLKAPHSGRYYMVWNKLSDEPLSTPSKRWIIRCWSRILGASLLNLNATVGWTDGQGVGPSNAWAQTLDQNCSQTLRRRMPVPSVHPTAHIEPVGCRTHLTHVKYRASDHPTIWNWFQLIQFSAFEFSVDSFASTLLPWTL